MNFIPFVLICMCIIALYSSMLLTDAKFALKQLVTIEAKQEIDHQNFFSFQETVFQYFPGKIHLPKKKTYENLRESKDLYERTKCNLYACFQSKEGLEFLEKAFMTLYPSLFQNEESTRSFIQELQIQAKKPHKMKTAHSLLSLVPESPANKTLFLQMIKGSSSTKKLENLFLFDPTAHQKPLCYHTVKMPLFEIAMGKELASELIGLEQMSYLKPNKKITKEELETFLKEKGFKEQEIKRFFNLFAFKGPKKKIIHTSITHPTFNLETTLMKELSR
jgi:hypothetical protein